MYFLVNSVRCSVLQKCTFAYITTLENLESVDKKMVILWVKLNHLVLQGEREIVYGVDLDS